VLHESFVITTYVTVRLIPHDSRALPLELFTKPSNLASFSTFYESIKDTGEGRKGMMEQVMRKSDAR
jgi:hypothetical protein